MDRAFFAACFVSVDNFLYRCGAVTFVRDDYIRQLMMNRPAILASKPPDNQYFFRFTLFFSYFAFPTPDHAKTSATDWADALLSALNDKIASLSVPRYRSSCTWL